MSIEANPPNDQREKLSKDRRPIRRPLVVLLRNRWVLMVALKCAKAIYDLLSDS